MLATGFGHLLANIRQKYRTVKNTRNHKNTIKSQIFKPRVFGMMMAKKWPKPVTSTRWFKYDRDKL